MPETDGGATAEAWRPIVPSFERRRRRGYLWATLVFLAFSLAGHWVFGWRRYVDEARAHQQPVVGAESVDDMLFSTFENWQSEFVQLLWQVCGLALFLYVGSPQYLLGPSAGGPDARREIDRAYLRE